MKIRTGAVLAFICLMCIQAYSQEKKNLTLDEAINLSLQNSKQLKISQAKIDEATASLKEAVEGKLPNASVSGSYLRLNSANIDLKTKDNNNGGSGGSGGGEAPKVNQALYGLLNVSLPIYQGGKIRYGIESSKYLEKAAQLDAEDDKDEVIQNTIEAFANLFKARTAVGLTEENLLQAQQRTKDFSNLEKNGLLARNDLLKAELQSSNVELSLLDAQNNFQLAMVNMNLMLGLPTATELTPDTTGVQQTMETRGLEEFIQAALTNRHDFAAADLRKKAAEVSVKTIKAERLPSISLTGGYIAADIPNVFSVTNAVNIGVGVSYNIASLWKNKSKVEQAEARVKQQVIANSLLDDNIRLQVNRSYLSLLSYRKKIEVYEKAVEQAKENYRIVKNKFDNSLATTQDLLDADLAQLQANLSYTLARADAFVAHRKLLQVSGLLSTELKK